MAEKLEAKRKIVRVAGRLREIVTVKDDKGNILQKVMRPLMLEFYPRDIVQVIVGATLLAVPVAFTEEVWNLGASLPLANALMILGLSVAFIAVFVYFNYYKNDVKQHWQHFLKRIVATYLFSFLVVTLFLVIIQRAPWQLDWVLAFKRTIIVTFPASMSATVADILK